MFSTLYKKTRDIVPGFFVLSHKDSNLNWLNQNEIFFHYTMGQS